MFKNIKNLTDKVYNKIYVLEQQNYFLEDQIKEFCQKSLKIKKKTKQQIKNFQSKVKLYIINTGNDNIEKEEKYFFKNQ